MKINLDLSKIAETGLKFIKENPILVIGTVVVGYIMIRDHVIIKRIDRSVKDLKENDLVRSTLHRMK